jgi:hypothetical protein
MFLSFCLDTKRNKKVKAVHPSLENYTSFHYLYPNSQTPFTDSFSKNPMAGLKQGFGYVPFRLFSYAMDVRPKKGSWPDRFAILKSSEILPLWRRIKGG